LRGGHVEVGDEEEEGDERTEGSKGKEMGVDQEPSP
jgi:hypothetical protein